MMAVHTLHIISISNLLFNIFTLLTFVHEECSSPPFYPCDSFNVMQLPMDNCDVVSVIKEPWPG